MKPSGRILIVDDSPEFLDTYRTILATEGYTVVTVEDGKSALAKLDEPGWDLVLLDRKLQGRFGPDTGLDLMRDIQTRAPGAKIILVTGVADAESVERAFTSGAYDYLEKNGYLEAILKIKVRNALEAARERRMAALVNGKREEALRELWLSVRTEKDPHQKGQQLEDLVALLDSFRLDIKRRFGRCRLGFFIGVGGFTQGFQSRLAASREDDALIVTLDANQLGELVESRDRNAKLKELHARALMASTRDA